MIDALVTRARELAQQMRDYGKEVEKQRKALDALAQAATWDERAARERARKQLAGARLELPAVSDFVAELEQAATKIAGEKRRGFVDQLSQAVQKAELQMQALGQQPPVFDVHGIQVEVDYDKEEARLAYGREALGKCALTPTAILRDREAHIARLQGAWPGAPEFFDAFAGAYRARAGRENKPIGERVFLVDLLPELELEYKLRKWKLSDALDKSALAYCLDRLAREGVLEKDGMRLELGTATGGSTKDKKRVLFLQKGLGGGQYYLTARVGASR